MFLLNDFDLLVFINFINKPVYEKNRYKKNMREILCANCKRIIIKKLSHFGIRGRTLKAYQDTTEGAVSHTVTQNSKIFIVYIVIHNYSYRTAKMIPLDDINKQAE